MYNMRSFPVRMWMVNPKIMCSQHLLGEHVELHMFVGHIKLKRGMEGFVGNGLVETSNIIKRHDVLVKEMLRRGYKHKSPISYKDKLDVGKVDKENSKNELYKRCLGCRKLQKLYG